jgi:hypothetical protein
MQENYLEMAIKQCGIQRIAAALGVTYPAVHKWRKMGMPRTEWTGETDYAAKIEVLTDGAITAQKLLSERRGVRLAEKKKQ